MKKFYGFIALLCCTYNAKAQPTLTASGINPVIGDVAIVKRFTPNLAQAGSSGSQTWSLGSITPTSTISAVTQNSIGSTYETSFPQSNICVKLGNDYDYYRISSDTLVRYGKVELSIGYPYSNGMTLLKYPVSYNSTQADAYRIVYSVGGSILITRNGNVSIVADAYGTLTTPDRTYSNVLRVKSTETYSDSIRQLSTGIITVSNGSLTRYTWYSQGIRYPILEMSFPSSGSASGFWAKWSGVGIEENLAAQLNMLVYPNPAQERSTLSLELTEASDVMVRVLDLQGREVIAGPMERYLPGKLQLPLDVANLASGNYLLQAIINDRNATIRFDKQ